MNGNSGEAHQPKFELPTGDQVQGVERVAEQSVEQRPAQESTLGKQQSPPIPVGTVLPAVPATINTTDDSAQAFGVAKNDSATPAADLDRIEKQWIDRAKSIVADTRNDPYEQKNQMSKVKVDYIKKRFNKTLPTDDAVKI